MAANIFEKSQCGGARRKSKPLSQDRVDLLVDIVLSGKPTWPYEVNRTRDDIGTTATAKIWLADLETRGFLKMEEGESPTKVPRKEYSPTLEGGLAVYCELYERNGWDKQITSQIIDAVEPLVNHSSFISACSKTSLWDELKRLPDFDTGVPHLEKLDQAIVDELKMGYFSFMRWDIISLQFAEILYNAACDMEASLFDSYRELPDYFETKFTQTMIQKFIDHAVRSLVFYDSIALADTKTMQLLIGEIIPELLKDIDKDHLMNGVKARINNHSLVIEGYTSVLGTIEHQE